MAQRQRRGVGGVGRLRRPGEPSRACTIFCTCSLSAPPQPATASFTWFGRVLDDLAAGGRGLGQGQPAGLADAHRRAHVDLEEHLLDGDGVGRELGDQRRQLGAAARPGAAAADRSGGVRITPSDTADSASARPPVDDGVPAARQPGIDAEHPRHVRNEHKFEW